MKHLLRELPPVHALQKSDTFTMLQEETNIQAPQLTRFVQQEIDHLRERIVQGNLPDLSDEAPSKQTFVSYIWQQVQQTIQAFEKERLTRVINGTGTVLHTNLGRARLSEQAIEHVGNAARSYSNLEYSLEKGVRGSRHDILEDLLIEATGAEAAMVVNNNAAAVYLVLRALAKHKEVIVSRGQLVEIGGSFRVSSIMEESDAKLVEVGTTNKTHLYDYEHAINENTNMILKVHTSNFKTIGFTESVATEELAALTRSYDQLVLYEDLGSGSLFNFHAHGIGEEPVVNDVIRAGVDLVSFSGDKLLGGPQAGIIVGKKHLIDQLKKHQLARVLRVDKMTFAGLEQTIRAYLSTEETVQQLPTTRDIMKPVEQILAQANQFMRELYTAASSFQLDVYESTSQIGGGTMPGVELPTYIVAISHAEYGPNQLAAILRQGNPSIVTRIKDDKICMDFRTISEEEMPELLGVFRKLR